MRILVGKAGMLLNPSKETMRKCAMHLPASLNRVLLLLKRLSGLGLVSSQKAGLG